MLNWIAGAKPAETAVSDVDSTVLDAPETPAPTFAVRAFKHAFFGTPQTVKPKPRSRSNVEKERPSLAEGSLPRAMERPKSSGDQGKRDMPAAEREPMPSPTKGILMTPGTAAARRKKVSFGEQVKDHEGKKDSKSGLPDDYPGKFPSPWVASTEPSTDMAQSGGSGRGRSKLTEALEQVRDESAKRRTKAEKHLFEADDPKDMTMDLTEPHSEAGKYWKKEYDLYRENTTREVKKLVAKQKAAKSFAKEKDSECTDLMVQLRQEKRRADRLEEKSLQLEAQLKEFKEKLRISEADRQAASETADIQQRRPEGSLRLARPTSKDGSKEKPTEPPIRPPVWEERSGSPTKKTESPLRSPERPLIARHERSKSHDHASKSEPIHESRNEAGTTRQFGRSQARPEKTVDQALKAEVDIWAQSFASSSPVAVRATDSSPERPRFHRSVTSGTDATPLKSLNINSLSAEKKQREDTQRHRHTQRETLANSLLSPLEKTKGPTVDDKRKDSFDVSIELPLPSPEPSLTTATAKSKDGGRPQPVEVPPSSPFEPHVESKPLSDRFTALRKAREETPPKPPVHRTKSIAAKENVSPTRGAAAAITDEPLSNFSKAQGANTVELKPAAGLRIANATGRDGRQVSNDRLEAARARLQAKGNRHVS